MTIVDEESSNEKKGWEKVQIDTKTFQKEPFLTRITKFFSVKSVKKSTTLPPTKTEVENSNLETTPVQSVDLEDEEAAKKQLDWKKATISMKKFKKPSFRLPNLKINFSKKMLVLTGFIGVLGILFIAAYLKMDSPANGKPSGSNQAKHKQAAGNQGQVNLGDTPLVTEDSQSIQGSITDGKENNPNGDGADKNGSPIKPPNNPTPGANQPPITNPSNVTPAPKSTPTPKPAPSPAPTPKPIAPITGTNLVKNSSFESSLTSWKSWTPDGQSSIHLIATDFPYKGKADLCHWSDRSYRQKTYQVLTGVPDGTYVAKIWYRSGGGQKTLNLEVTKINNGSGSVTVGLPKSPDVWKQVTTTKFEVRGGTVHIGVYSNANSGNWADFDNIELIRVG